MAETPSTPSREVQFLRGGLRTYVLLRWVMAAGVAILFVPALAGPFSLDRRFTASAFLGLAGSTAILEAVIRAGVERKGRLFATFLLDAVLVETISHAMGGASYGFRYFCVFVLVFAASLLSKGPSLAVALLIAGLHTLYLGMEFLGVLPRLDFPADSPAPRLTDLFYSTVPHDFIVLAVWWTVSNLAGLLREEIRGAEGHAQDLDRIVAERTRQLEIAQQAMIRSEKLSVLGQTVSSVAHELNNPLTGVLGYAQLLKTAPTGSDTALLIERLNQEAERCRRIARNLLVYSRESLPEKKPMDVNSLVRDVAEVRRYNAVATGLSVELELVPDLPMVEGDVNQLRQVLLNVILNAEQAIAETGRPAQGRIVIRTGVLVRTDAASRSREIFIRIWNNGPTITPEVQMRLFEPFFTTKEPGKGTGLGLFVATNIMAAHGGTIGVENGNGEGAAFTLRLPAGETQVAHHHVKPVEAPPLVQKRSPRRVLVVDDEDFIRDVVTQALSADGDTVLSARDGPEALEILATETPDVILVDYRMPGMSGEDVAREIGRLYPALAKRIVIVSGLSASEELRDFLSRSGLPHMTKPFNLDELKGMVHGR
ncbi:MAG: response regulator [Nitrospirae bacterium]|nr:response regulator [Nitrospirota bacterium]